MQYNFHSKNKHTDYELSIVITIVSGSEHLKDCIDSILSQIDFNARTTEIIVPYDEHDMAIANLVKAYPTINFFPMEMSVKSVSHSCHEHFDELRARGLSLANGRIIAILEDHEVTGPYWYRNILHAHNDNYAAIGGPVDNSINKAINWATYFFDFGRYQNPVNEGPSSFLTDVNVSYKRNAIYSIQDIWKDGFHEPAVHGALLKQGETLWMSPEIIVYQNRKGLTIHNSIRERFIWGRYFSEKRVEGKSTSQKLAYGVLSLAVPFIIFTKMSWNVLIKRRLLGTYIISLPIIILLIMSWSAGEFTGYVAGRKKNRNKNVEIQ